MTITISDGVDEIEPVLVLGWSDTSEALNVEHRIIGRADVDVTVREDALPAGDLPLLFDDRATAVAARTFLRTAAAFTLVDTDRPELDITFTRKGAMRLEQTDDRIYWTLTVGFQQVLA